MNNLTQLVVDTICEKIREKKVSPSMRITETELADELNISRTPVREALRQLERDGLIISIANLGTFVRDISIEDVIELYEVRSVLEGLAARLFTRICSAPKIPGTLSALAEKYDHAFNATRVDSDKIEELDAKFHNLIIRNCGNKELIKTLSGNNNIIQIFRLRRSIISLKNVKSGAGKYSHRNIVEAIRKKDCKQAEKIARNHVLQGKDTMVAAFLSGGRG